ncbi:hypothetical protein Y032_0114g456 [Ancylostoma ceylanicum]|uniref:Uncharacterized protein n=1 Tax=Ancylostoma ceylanicum TaxID=53326 RepID=A0A016TDD3_9BILA|nr:hypothetical protein Y032_0114g456 [Ancylostoma ceylanicum]
MTPLDTPYTFSAPMAFIYPSLSQKTCVFLPSAARTFDGCSRDARMIRPITAQQRTSCHAAVHLQAHGILHSGQKFSCN